MSIDVRVQVPSLAPPSFNNQICGCGGMADALASGASDRKVVWVQVPSPAPIQVVEIRLVFLLLIHFKTAVAELHQIFDLVEAELVPQHEIFDLVVAELVPQHEIFDFVEAELVPHTESASFRC